MKRKCPYIPKGCSPDAYRTPVPRVNRVRPRYSIVQVNAPGMGAGCMDHVAALENLGVHLAIGLLIDRGPNFYELNCQ